jgi:hypothetical protein
MTLLSKKEPVSLSLLESLRQGIVNFVKIVENRELGLSMLTLLRASVP